MLPEHLRPDLETLHRAYPDGVPDEDYLPLLVVHWPDFSDRNLSALVAELAGAPHHAKCPAVRTADTALATHR